MSDLQIYDRRERRLVALADAALAPLAWVRSKPAARPVHRVLLLRLERIGDLLMTLDAIRLAGRVWPEAEIDLAVGSWNLPLARLIPGISRVDVVDVPWLAREGTGATWSTLRQQARTWRGRRYDVIVNFEPDIRSNWLAWTAGAPRRFGYWTGGGGAFLTDAAAYEPMTHVAVNARRIVARAAGKESDDTSSAGPSLTLPPDALARADQLLAGLSRPIVGIHASGGRPSKQWHPDRFAAVAAELARTHHASVVLTGTETDRALVSEVARGLGTVPAVQAVGFDLVTLAAILSKLDLLVTGDTGPMHLAAAMETPIVALFGPSHPQRYGPLSTAHRVVRIDLPCSPCGQVRLPPERCRGHVPDCLDGISVRMVVDAAAPFLA